jgi:hypothetical protein
MSGNINIDTWGIAEEITKLRAENAALRADKERLMQERDDADTYIRSICLANRLPFPMDNKLFNRLTIDAARKDQP